MAADDLNLADLQDLIELLEGAGLEASLEPGKLDLPGVWVQVVGIAAGTLAGVTIRTRLWCIHSEANVVDALDKLSGLYNAAQGVLAGLGGPAGDTEARTVSLPGQVASLPALVIPFDLLTTQE